jgi:FkbM family methyltransferase
MLPRTALERATHRLVVRRRLPSPFTAAKLYATTEGGLRYLRPRLDRVDPVLLRLADEVIRPGDSIWDIGANLGLFTFAAAVAAGPTGRILAVEPDTALVGLLRRSAAANPRQALVDVLPAAVSDELGVNRFHIARRNRSTSHLDGFGTSQTGGIRTTQLVPTLTMDWMAVHLSLPDIIKIDVEGAEMKVLSGAGQLLHYHPTIICEVAGANAEPVQKLLASHGYTLYDGDQPPSRRIPMVTAPPNTLAISHCSP